MSNKKNKIQISDKERELFWNVCRKIAKKVGYGTLIIKCHDYKCQDIEIAYKMHANSNLTDKRLSEAGLGFLTELYQDE